MPELEFVTYHVAEGAEGMSRITDLLITGDRLYSTTSYDGQMTFWNIDGLGLEPEAAIGHQRGESAGGVAGLSLLSGPGGATSLLTGGGFAGALSLYDLKLDGSFGTVVSLGVLPVLGGDLTHVQWVDLGDAQIAYGGLQGQAGVGWLRFEAGSLTDLGVVADNNDTFADDLAGLTHAVVGGQHYLFSAGGPDLGLTSWSIGVEGALQAEASLAVEQGLWIAAPSALQVAQAAGDTYLIPAAAGSSSLSVIEVRATGQLRVTDHVMDDLNSRFGGVTALEVVTHTGHSWVIAGGADDGISLFRLLPGRRLLSLAHMADSLDAGLTNISDISARFSDRGIDIFVASSVEPGITRLRFNTGSDGEVLVGGNAGGTLMGTRLDDVLMDGAGVDTLMGGAGADTFVMLADGGMDVIVGFVPGEDRLDLSGWAMLRNTAQLDMAQTDTGFSIRYGDESLDVRSVAGVPIDPGTLPVGDLIASLRLQPDLFVSADVAPLGGNQQGTSGNDRLQASAAGQQLFGRGGNDTLTGGARLAVWRRRQGSSGWWRRAQPAGRGLGQ